MAPVISWDFHDFPGFLFGFYRDEWELTWIYWDFIGCDRDF
jgi:hypothetical protein